LVADKFEREIEEILAKLDDKLPPADPVRAPISIADKRQQKAKATRVRTQRKNPLAGISTTTFLFAGAGIMFGALILSNIWGPLIWASFAGVVLFLGAFVASLRRTSRPGPTSAPQGNARYWRDRYIDDRPTTSQSADRIKGWFRRK